MMIIYCGSEQEQMQAAADLSQRLGQQAALIYLSGDLGAGKTTWVRGFLQARGYTGRVKSPTYTLVESYPLNPPVHHLDLYRLSDGEELEFIGFRDLYQKKEFILIEWPEKAAAYLPAPDVQIRIEFSSQGRCLQIEALTNPIKKILYP